MNEAKHPEMEDDEEEYELTASDIAADDDDAMLTTRDRLRGELEHGNRHNNAVRQAADMIELYISLDVADADDIYVRSTQSGLMLKVWCRDGPFGTLVELNDQFIRGLTREAHTERFHYDSTKKYDLLEIEE